jgi:uncharacterized protein (UPF0276 family)
MAANLLPVGDALPELGVGITYFSGIENLLISSPGLIDVLELEPQTFWIKKNKSFYVPSDVISFIENLPGKKLVHSVGLPIGGNLSLDKEQLKLLKQTIDYFHSPWVSEHMGFNATHEFQTGFFLPQRQTDEGIQVAVKNIKTLQQSLGVPIAIETGVNYLRKRNDELPDGVFVRHIIEEAGCGLLLDLHNIFTNEWNGRQKIDEFLSQIPLERVWEVHLAGGIEMDGYWLDAHSGAMPHALLSIAKETLPQLPNVKAIIFELLPVYLSIVGEPVVKEQLQKIRELWDGRKNNNGGSKSYPGIEPKISVDDFTLSTSEWERILSHSVTGQLLEKSVVSEQVISDPGVHILNKLINEFRGSMLVSVYRLTCRYIMLSLGVETFQIILNNFWKKYPPRLFASEEVSNFSEYIKKENFNFPTLYSVLRYEEAVVATLMDGQGRVVQFEHDPIPLLRCLADGKLTDMNRQEGNYEIEITPGNNYNFNGFGYDVLAPLNQYH